MTAMRLPLVPASAFSVVLGLIGLTRTWRLAHEVWSLPAWPVQWMTGLATGTWALLVVLYLCNWAHCPSLARAELEHPVRCCYVGLIGVSTVLVAGALAVYSRLFAIGLLVTGAACTVTFAIWRIGILWQGGRAVETNTPVLYLPAVAGSHAIAIALGDLGYGSWGQMFFGAGLLSWLSIESVLIHRLLTAPGLRKVVRPTLGIQLAPAPLSALSYLSTATQFNETVVNSLVGYGLLQVLIVARLFPWALKRGPSIAYWGYTFGITSLAATPLQVLRLQLAGPATVLAPALFVLANTVIAWATAVVLQLAIRWLQRSRLRPLDPAGGAHADTQLPMLCHHTKGDVS